MSWLHTRTVPPEAGKAENGDFPHLGMSPMSYPGQARLAQELESIREQGLFKAERVITSPQSAEIELEGGRKVLNFCANNYLGLADHPEVIKAAKEALDTHGFG